MKKILVFAGSNSENSINQKLVVYSSSFLKNVELNIFELKDFSAPLFSVDLEKKEGFPKSMIALNNLIKSCDGVILSLPEYNSSMTPVFKNTVDWISRIERPTFKDKPLLLLSTSAGKRGGQTNLKSCCFFNAFLGWKSNCIIQSS
ncbi:MAG: NAD(P)H-dependent oxidoreductase [Bacteroidetes bacterium]|nr:NAD(P)H-dependent oxidoreductase [Bacteroidota bacterium]